jgi:hypothetical protein
MRYRYYFPPECIRVSVEFYARGIPGHPKEESDSIRQLCELYNDGHYLYARQFEYDRPTDEFLWQPYRSTHPLVCTLTGRKRNTANLRSSEMVSICLDSHLGNTALVMFDYYVDSRKRAWKYLVIREGTSVRVEIHHGKELSTIVFDKRWVC